MPKSIVFRDDNYFEAIIQLRPYNDEVFSFIESQILKRKDHVEITKLVEQKTGVDVYLTSQRFARGLGSKLKRRFRGGVLKMTRKLHTRDKQRSRNVYRVTVLFRWTPPEKKLD